MSYRGGLVVAVRGQTLKGFREEAGIGRRGLARALVDVRGAVGDHAAMEAARQFLLRLERRDGDTEMSEEEAAVLAEALGIEPRDLSEHLLWAWREPKSGRFHAIMGTIVAWTEAEPARGLRDALVLAGGMPPEYQVSMTTRTQVARVAAVPGWDPGVLINYDPRALNALVHLEAMVRGVYEDRPDLESLAVEAIVNDGLNLEAILRRETDRLYVLGQDPKPDRSQLAILKGRLPFLLKYTNLANTLLVEKCLRTINP